MAFDSEKFQKLVDYSLNRAKETIEVVDLLIEKDKPNHAINRIYHAMHCLMMVTAAKNNVNLSLPEPLMEWFKKTIVKEQKAINYKFSMIVENAFRDRKAADYDPHAYFTLEQANKKNKELKEFFEEIEKYIAQQKELPNEDIIEGIKIALRLHKQPEISSEIKRDLDGFVRFLKSKLFLTNIKGRQVLDECLIDPYNEKSLTQLEVRFEDAIEQHNNYKGELSIFVNKVSANKHLIKTQPIPTPQPEEKPAEPAKQAIASEQETEVDADADDKFVEQEIKSNVILSLWDFTELAEHALEHAVHFADASGADVKLLHIVKKTKEIDEANNKLKTVLSLAQKKYNKEIGAVVRAGNIFTDISIIAEELSADLVILGTHGLKGMQKVTGSWALKVIKESPTPFVVIQGPPVKTKIENIILPVDHKRGTKKLMNEVKYLTQHFNIKFFVCKPAKYATNLQQKKGVSNYVFVNSYMKQNGKNYETFTVGDHRNFSEMVIDFGKAHGSELIMVITNDGSNANAIDESKLIYNKEKIPVLCVNPLSAKAWGFSTQAAN